VAATVEKASTYVFAGRLIRNAEASGKCRIPAFSREVMDFAKEGP
jgi:hypothetical protein